MTTDRSLTYGASPEEITAAIDAGNIRYTDDPLPDDLPGPPAPGEEMMVHVSVRVTTGTAHRIRALAAARGVGYTIMLREWIELELAEAERDHEHPFTREDRLKALDMLRKALEAEAA